MGGVQKPNDVVATLFLHTASHGVDFIMDQVFYTTDGKEWDVHDLYSEQLASGTGHHSKYLRIGAGTDKSLVGTLSEFSRPRGRQIHKIV